MAIHKPQLFIDIAPDAIDVIRVPAGAQRQTPALHCRVPMPEGEAGLSDALHSLCDQMDVVGCRCTVMLPLSWLSVFNLTFPFRHPAQIRKVLHHELASLHAVPMDNFAFDFQMMPATDPAEVLAVTIPRDRLAGVLDALAACRLHAETVTLGGGYAQAHRLASLDDAPGTFAVVQVAEAAVSLSIAHERTIRLVRLLGHPATVGAPNMASAAARTLIAYRERFAPKQSVEAFWVLGEGSFASEMAEALESISRLPVHRSAEHSTEIAAPAPLTNGWRRGRNVINLRQGEFAVRVWQTPTIRAGIGLAAMSLLLMLSMTFHSYAEAVFLENRATRIRDASFRLFAETCPEVTRIVEPVSQLKGKIAEQWSASPGWADVRRFDVIDVMAEVSRTVPADVNMALSTITVQRNNILLQGATGSYRDVDGIKSAMESSGRFKRITITSANFKRADNRVVFSLVIEREQEGEL